jgi:hypothetical protein
MAVVGEKQMAVDKLAALTRNEISSHTGSLLNPPDDTDIPTASHECTTGRPRPAGICASHVGGGVMGGELGGEGVPRDTGQLVAAV